MYKKNKKWLSGGVEDKFMLKLIKDKKISKFTKPSYLKENFPSMFGEYSEGVVRNHLNVLKRNNGLYLEADNQIDDSDDVENKDEMGENSHDIKFDNSDQNKNVLANNVDLTIKNYTVLCEQYKDPENQQDMVYVAIDIPGGGQNVRMDLNEDGTRVDIRFEWTKVMYDMNDLFKKELDAKTITLYHPKVVAVKNALEKIRSKIDTAPETEFSIKLPIQVQTSLNSYVKNGIFREDGSLVLTAIFKGYIKKYSKRHIDSAVMFEK